MRVPCIALCLLAALAACAAVRVEVSANGHVRIDKPVEVAWKFPKPVRVAEVNVRGSLVNPSVPFQFDPGEEEGTLIFVLSGRTAPNETRYFEVHFEGPATRSFRPQVTVEQVDYRGQESFKITTRASVYYYHKAGAGFASLIDKDGNDWINYRPGGGSAGEYRGIPNLVHPGSQFHPGGANSITDVVAQGPLRCSIRSRTSDGKWSGTWHIYPGYATFTLLKAGRNYWFLYEGTPGGRLYVDSDYWVRSTGERRPVSESWEGKLTPPRWVYFGDARLNRVLFLVHHENDGEYDQFWQMQGNMTVFGFGRKYRCCDKSLRQTPARFTVGLAETADFTEAARTIESAYTRLAITVTEMQRGN
jgi:hypothetical protein